MKTYNFIPGPVPMEDDVANTLATEFPYFRASEFSQIVKECQVALLEKFNAPEGSQVIFLTGSGTAAMEASLLNLVSDNEQNLLISGGGFGDRFGDILNRQNKKFIKYNTESGKKIDEMFFDSKCYDNIIINGHETTTGFVFDLNRIGNHFQDSTLIVDAISLTLTDKIDMSLMNIDCLIFSSHKAFGLYPGLSFIILNEKMINRIETLKLAKQSIYFDFNLYLSDIKRGQTPFTPAIPVIMQLHALVTSDNFKTDYYETRSENLANYFRKQIQSLPLSVYSEVLPNAMTAVILDSGYSAKYVYDELAKRHIFVAPSGGKMADRMLRISHMGNQDIKDIDYLIQNLKDIFRCYKSD